MVKRKKQILCKSLIRMFMICLIIITIVFSNSIIVMGIQDNGKLKTMDEESLYLNTNHNFIIDSPVKYYNNINKLEQVSNFKFKIPDFMPKDNKVVAFQLRKLSEKSSSVEIFFENSNGSFAFQAFKGDPIEALMQIERENTKTIENSKVDYKKEPLKLDGISGLNITLTTTFPIRRIGENNFGGSQKISQYYVWENEGVWYSIEYNSFSKNEEVSNVFVSTSQEALIRIVKSIKYPEEIKNYSYKINELSSAEPTVINIYDKEDLEEAKNSLKFNPKFPLKVYGNIEITNSIVGISNDTNLKNSKNNYELSSFYSNENGSITFIQGKNSQAYDNIKNTGYVNNEMDVIKPIKAERLNISNIEVFKYSQGEIVPQVNYLWKENDIYFSISFFVNIENSDDIVKEFINSKPL